MIVFVCDTSLITIYLLLCFFKQKTAYEMRISDLSSDVCSSDLAEEAAERHVGIGDLAALLVDHHTVDRTELVAGCIVHFGAFDLVGGNQAVRCCRSHGSSPSRFMVAVGDRKSTRLNSSH